MTLRDAITEASATIFQRDAEVLLLHLLQRDRAWLMAHFPEPLDEPTHTQLQALTQRRAAHEPLQHLTCQQEFYGLTLRVTPDTLIPRPETELLVEAVLDNLPSHSTLHIADIGTGTGAIAIAIAANCPTAAITATDISPAALAIARENAAAHHLTGRITFVESDLLASFPQQADVFDVIVSNPPYIPSTDAPTLQPEVLAHEPHGALFAGPDGLDIYRRLIPQAHAALSIDGLLALEIGFGQSEAITHLLTGWRNLRILPDYASIPRIVLATRP